jgi:hypothetical protein
LLHSEKRNDVSQHLGHRVPQFERPELRVSCHGSFFLSCATNCIGQSSFRPLEVRPPPCHGTLQVRGLRCSVWYALYTVAALLFWLQHSLSSGQFNPVNHPFGRGEMPERGLTGAGPLPKEGPREHPRRCRNLASTGKGLAVSSISALRYSGP